MADKCTGCGLCIETCPNGALQLANGIAILAQAACTQCQVCVDACPEGAISAVEMPIVATGPYAVQSVHESKDMVTNPVPIDSKPWLLSALAFAGQEILPRLAEVLIGVLDRRLALAQPVKTQISIPPEHAEPAITPNRKRDYHRRYRIRFGRRHRKGRSLGTGKGNSF